MIGDGGWIKIHRSIWDNPWMYKPYVYDIWSYILCHVNYKPTDVIFEGKRITLQPGQGLFKLREMSVLFKIPLTSLHRIINLLKNETQIETQTSPRNTVITVVNWQKYQISGTQNGTQVEHKRNTNGTQAEHLPIIKEFKEREEREEKEKVKKERLDFDIFWEAYPRKKGKGDAYKAFEKAIKKVTLETILEALNRQKCSAQWTRDNGQYIPYPVTWLNGERWEDEPDFTPVDNQRPRQNPHPWNDAQAGYEGALKKLEGLIDEQD